MTWRAVTFAVWGCLGAALIGCAVVARLSSSWPAPGAMFRIVTGGAFRRLAVIVGWMWLGWHVFAR